jgi:DNA repair protein RecO (recombination protein O)
MPHHVYNTRAFVLGSRPRGDVDKLFLLLTPDLGLVAATARGVRRPLSRLKGILLDLGEIEVSLVRGKHEWRLTTATLLVDNAGSLRGDKQALRALARVASLLERLIHGEEEHRELFAALQASTKVLRQSSLAQGGIDAWEVCIVAEILYHLGYLTQENVPKDIDEATAERAQFVSAINMGLRESGLS